MLIRIVQDTTNRDGWSARLLSSDDKLSGKVCFIANINYTIQDLMPGQIWNAQLIQDRSNYYTINLTSRL